AAPEDRPALRAAVAGTREQHEVTVGVDAGERVVVDLRLQGRVVVAHLASGAAVEPDVGRLGGDVLLATIELDSLYAPLAEEGGQLVAPPGLRARVRHVEGESPARVLTLERAAAAGRQVPERLGLAALVTRVAAARPGRAPDHRVVATAPERREHALGVGHTRRVPLPAVEAVRSDQDGAVEEVDARRDAERVVHVHV